MADDPIDEVQRLESQQRYPLSWALAAVLGVTVVSVLMGQTWAAGLLFGMVGGVIVYLYARSPYVRARLQSMRDRTDNRDA